MKGITIEFIGFFFCSIVFFAFTILSFKGKISHRWRSGYIFATKDEQQKADFKRKSKVQALIYLLGGITAILFGCYFQYLESWMIPVAMSLGLMMMISGIVSGIIFGKREKRRRKDVRTKKSRSLVSDTNEQFSITEIRIDLLRMPIIFGCYILIPISLTTKGLVFVYQIPKEYLDPEKLSIFLVFSLIVGVGSWLLNKTLPKMTFSYSNGYFRKEKNGKVVVFSKESIKKVVMESLVLPNYIYFYINDKKRPIKILMRGFKQDDQFEIPRKVISITKTKLTKVENKILNDFD